MGDPVFAPGWLHPRVHDWTRPSQPEGGRVQETEREADRPLLRWCGRPWRLEQGKVDDIILEFREVGLLWLNIFFWTLCWQNETHCVLKQYSEHTFHPLTCKIWLTIEILWVKCLRQLTKTTPCMLLLSCFHSKKLMHLSIFSPPGGRGEADFEFDILKCLKSKSPP